MRIISKFRDFYDSVMKTGMDREVVYLRESRSIETTEDFGVNFTTGTSASTYRSRMGYSADLLFLGYCGQIIRVVNLKYLVKNSSSDPESPHYLEYRRVFFDFDEFEKFMIDGKYATDWDFDATRQWGSTFGKFHKVDTRKMEDIFHRFQVPVFTLTYQVSYFNGSKTTINLGPRLKDLDFHKFKDPYSTYQDIFQYVAGVLNHPENKMVKISDKDKIAKHGFDKWSFRQKGPKK